MTEFITRLEGEALESRLLARSANDIEARRSLHQFVADNAQELTPPSKSIEACQLPRRTFVYWAQGFENSPPIVQACYRQLIATQPPNSVMSLDDKTIASCIEIPPHIHDRLNNNKTHFSDVIRVSLLAEYGGVWSDATCLHMRDLRRWSSDLLKGDFFAYTRNDTFLLSNWFLVANKNSTIATMMRDILFIYWEKRSHLEHYFLFHFLFEALYNQCNIFRDQWDIAPNISAIEPHLLQADLKKNLMPKN